MIEGLKCGLLIGAVLVHAANVFILSACLYVSVLKGL